MSEYIFGVFINYHSPYTKDPLEEYLKPNAPKTENSLDEMYSLRIGI